MIPLVLIPSCNPERAAIATERWQAQGYRVLVYTDDDLGRYPGYFPAIAQMVRATWRSDVHVWIAAADDLSPDPTMTGPAIAQKYLEKFPDGFGVLQPTGDRLAGTALLCGSPWFGRGWVEQAYQGMGPHYQGYRQFYGDEEMLYVARTFGVLWQHPYLTQRHDHWIREGGPPKTPYQILNDRYYAHDKWLHYARQAAGWPGAGRP